MVKKRGETPVFIHSPIERDEAAASELPLVNMARYRFTEILRETGDRLKATVELYRRIFADLGVRGDVGFYGMADQRYAYVFLSALAEALPVRLNKLSGNSREGSYPSYPLFPQHRGRRGT